MKPHTHNLLCILERADHLDNGLLSCGGDEYRLTVGKDFWEVDSPSNRTQMLEIIEQDKSIISFALLSGANSYDHAFSRKGEGWLITVEFREGGVIVSETTLEPVSMTVIIDSHPDVWDEFDWKREEVGTALGLEG